MDKPSVCKTILTISLLMIITQSMPKFKTRHMKILWTKKCTLTQLELEGISMITAWIKLCSVKECTRVIHWNINNSTLAQAYPLYFSNNKMRKQSIDHPKSAIYGSSANLDAEAHIGRKMLQLNILLVLINSIMKSLESYYVSIYFFAVS